MRHFLKHSQGIYVFLFIHANQIIYTKYGLLLLKFENSLHCLTIMLLYFINLLTVR